MRNTPTELILLQIAEGLQSLAKNPDLSKTIKEAYALSEAEKSKADEARAIIAQADQFTADLKRKQDALVDIDTRIAEAKKIEAYNEDEAKRLSILSNEISGREKAVKLVEAANEDRTKRLMDFQAELNAREVDLDDKAGEVAKGKADLKKRADILKAQTADL